MNKATVSILTITQLSRSDCLKILLECIKNQTYNNIKEWVIVDGSKTMDEGMCNQILINELINANKDIKFQIKYIPYKDNSTFGELKNKANNNASGDYLIWMDDDDYHIPGRIEYSVNKLKHNNKLIGGNFNIYLYSMDLNRCFKTNIQINGRNKIISGTLIYNRKFLDNHMYPNVLNNLDDEQFLANAYDDFELMIPETTVIKLVHSDNSTDIKQLIINASVGNLSFIQKLEVGVRKYLIPDQFYEKYKNIMKIETNEFINYDIVYYTGIHGIQWDPIDQKLGGSEQAVVNLSENWVKLGKSVVVYGNFVKDKIVNGVSYKYCMSYPFDKRAKVLVVWRTPGIVPLLDIEFKANNVIVDFHDNFSYTLVHLDKTKLINFFEKVNKINFKSSYHKTSFEEFMGEQLNDNKYNIIPNGIRVVAFANNKNNATREAYRFCYCSSYDRGLEYILENVWPHIYKQEPKAEFHIYYGMEHLYDTEYKQRLITLMNQPGVTDHGRQPMDVIIKEKYMSTFHLYLCTSVAEIDCISIRESLVTGCIPVISKYGVFADRHGLQFTWDPTNKVIGEMVANDLVNKMNNITFIESASNQLKCSNTIIDWYDIAKQWLERL